MSFTLGIKDGDFDFDDYGSVVVIEGADKTSQDLGQIQVSAYDPNRGYGTRITPGAVPNTAGEAFIATELNMTVERLQALQSAASNTTDDERIVAVTRLDVNRADDKTSYDYRLEVRTADDNISTSGNVTRRRVSMGHLNP